MPEIFELETVRHSSFGNNIWTDGINIYYSAYEQQFVLNCNTWEEQIWNGLTYFSGNYILLVGDEVYCIPDEYSTYKLEGDTWVEKDWHKLNQHTIIWTDGTNIYSSTLSDRNGRDINE